MSLIQYPRTPWLIRIIAWIGALILGGAIVYLVFNFGYYASGLAVVKDQEKQRTGTPIRMEFSDPNAAPPPKAPADPNAS